MISLSSYSPIRSADGEERDSLLSEVLHVDRLFALCDLLLSESEEHSCIVSRTHSVADDVEEPGSA